jgi:LytS/YehU family sensor histidine kinase
VVHIGYFSQLRGTEIALERAFLIVSLYLAVFYLNWFILIPKLYINRKFLLFSISILLVIFLGAWWRIEIEHITKILPGLFDFRGSRPRPFKGMLLTLVLISILIIISSLFRIIDFYNQKTRQEKILIEQKNEAELKLLRLQLNPHFLFNALNNIYALVLTKSENASNSLMSLSQLLRYIIYDATADKVPLSDEIRYLKYYIELESLRLVNPESVRMEIKGNADTFNIMPLIFIPFIENSFKHSNINKGGHIYIVLEIKENYIDFRCENSISNTVKQKDKTGGIGLVNTQKRLELVYEDKHKLEIEQTDQVFKIRLTIEL